MIWNLVNSSQYLFLASGVKNEGFWIWMLKFDENINDDENF